MKTTNIPPKAETADTNINVEERLSRIEVRLGLRPAPVAPIPTVAKCSKSGLTMPAQFFPAPTVNQMQISTLWSAYSAALPDEQKTLADPKKLAQPIFDQESSKFFEPDERLTVSRLREFLRLMAQQHKGKPATVNFAIRGNPFGKQAV